MNLKRTAAATAAAATILLTSIAGGHASAAAATRLHLRPAALINRGSVWDERGASIWTRNQYGHTEIIYQGQHLNQITDFRLRYDARCVYVSTSTVWSSGWYKASPNITHPTRNYGIDVYAWSKCPRNANWISAVL